MALYLSYVSERAAGWGPGRTGGSAGGGGASRRESGGAAAAPAPPKEAADGDVARSLRRPPGLRRG